MAIKIEMLRCFCIVAQTGNLAEAAERLGRTQSAVSMSLKQLEQHIGKPLFEGERKNRLTVLGEEVFKLAQKQVRQFEHTINSIGETAKSEHGLVRIVSVPSVGALIFPAVLDILAARYPKLKVEIRDTDTQRVLDALAEGEADIGIASGYHPINGVEAIALFEDRFGLVCAADHPLITQTAPPTIEEVVAAPFVRNALSDNIQTQAFVNAMEGAAILLHNNPHADCFGQNRKMGHDTAPDRFAIYAGNHSVSFRFGPSRQKTGLSICPKQNTISGTDRCVQVVHSGMY